MLKFFAEKKCEKATHIFSAKNISILYIESAKTVNEMTLNECVKLKMLWTTGPWIYVQYNVCLKLTMQEALSQFDCLQKYFFLAIQKDSLAKKDILDMLRQTPCMIVK